MTLLLTVVRWYVGLSLSAAVLYIGLVEFGRWRYRRAIRVAVQRLVSR